MPAPFLVAGDQAQVLITAKNLGGTADATNVKMTVPVPFGFALASAGAVTITPAPTSPAGYDASTGTWTIGNLARNGMATLLLKGTVRSDVPFSQIVAAAAITGTQTDFAPDNNQASATMLTPNVILVDSAADDNNMTTLRKAITQANADPGQPYVIKPASTLASPQTITLTGGVLPITGSISIFGYNPGTLTISGNMASRIFDVQGTGTLTLNNLTLTKGKVTAADKGGAIQNAGTLNLNNVMITMSSSAQDGGAIYNTGSLSADGSTLMGNTSSANGGAISSVGGSLVLNNTTVDTNTATLSGGGLYLKDKSDSITGGTIKNNKAAGSVTTPKAFGGGIEAVNGRLSVTNAMFMANTAPVGGGMEVFSTDANNPAVVDLVGDTFTSNLATSDNANATNRGGALANYGGSLIRVDNSSFVTNKASNPAGTTDKDKNNPKAGAVYNGVGSYLIVSRSTFSGNDAPRQSGAIDNPGTLLVTESTLTGNTTKGFGAAIDTKGRATVKSSTIAGNTATLGGGGIATFSTAAQDGTLYLGSSIVATNNPGGPTPDVSIFNSTLSTKPGLLATAVRSLGYNLIDLGDTSIAWKTTDLFGVTGKLLDPKLGALDLHGGMTQNFVPANDSPAINRGKPNPGDATDQLGMKRVVGVASDIGSVETAILVTPPLPDTANNGSLAAETPASSGSFSSSPPSFAFQALTAGSGTITVTGATFVEAAAGELDATFDDPGSTDDASAYTVTVDWGDGMTSSTSPDVTLSGTAGSYTLVANHTYADEGSFDAVITISKSGVDNVQPIMITVGDADVLTPDATSPSSVPGVEGTALTNVVVARFDDAFAGNPASHFSASINWGDKAVTHGTITLVDPGAGGTPYYEVTGSHLYSEDDTYAAAVTITDGTAGQTLMIPVAVVVGEDPTFTVTPSPTITTQDGTPTGPALKEGTTMSGLLLATFQHANGTENAGDFVATIDWGDGTSSDSVGMVTLNGSSYEVRGSHTYSEDGNWPITITITDTVDTEIEPDSPPVTANTMAVVQEDTFATTGGQSLTGHTGESLNNVVLGTFQHSDGWESPTSDFQVSINWGDDTPVDDPSAVGLVQEDDVTGIYTILGSHTYTAASPPAGYNITVTITDMSSTADLTPPPLQATVTGDTATITTVNAPPTFTSLDHTTFTVGTAGTFTVTTHSVGPVPVLTETDNLPAGSGITFHDNGDGTGTISGTPAAGTGGGYTLNITANNGIPPNGTQTFTLNVNQAPSITSPDHATFSVGKLNVFTVTTQGFPTNVALTETDNLPAGSGVSFHDNGDGTATIAGTPAAAAAGTFTFNITADNGTAPPATQTLTLNITATGTNQAFVQALYQTVLGRTGPTADVNAWVAVINAGVPRIIIAQAFWESPEHRAIQVRSYYATYLHRTPSPAEVQGWVGVFQAGATENGVIQGFVLSPEYLQAQDSDSAFVSSLYNDILGRPADAPGLAFWVQMLQDSTTRTTVARAFLTFPEAIKRTVDIDYATLLQRPSQPAEEQTWINALATGFSPSSIAEQFLASDEFFIRF
jgi:hypothetical protein